MRKKIFYIFAHQDDEFGIFAQLKKDINLNEPIIFYLTSGTGKKIDKNKLYLRDKESLKSLISLGVKKKNIIFIGRKLGIKHNKLYLNSKKIILFFEKFISNNFKPDEIFTHSWEGGHEDHDTCNLITRKIKIKYKIKNCYQFSLYNAFNTNILFYKVFNPISKKNRKKIFAKFKDRILFLKLLFNYRSQIKTWIGLYPFVISHYLFKGFNIIEKLNTSKIISRPHSGRLLYEKRNFCKFSDLKRENKFLFKN